MVLHLCIQLYHIRLQTRHLSCQHSHLSLDPPSRGVIAPLIAATIAFASNDTCKTRATSVIVLQGPCTTARVEDVADLSACSRGSSAQCFFFFRIRRASNTHNSWSSAPGIFLHPRILLLQRKRARHTSLRRSASITTVPTLILNTQPPTANSLFHTRQTSSGHS